MALAAGKLRHRVMLLRATESRRASDGQVVREWVDVEPRWARVDDLSAGMVYKAAAAGTRVKTMVTLREPVDLTPLVSGIRFESWGRVRTLGVVEVRRRPEADYVEVFCLEAP